MAEQGRTRQSMTHTHQPEDDKLRKTPPAPEKVHLLLLTLNL